jgi:hypothetical protein
MTLIIPWTFLLMQNFVVNIGAPFPAQLPMLSFEGATRRNRPNLVAGGKLDCPAGVDQ